MKIRPAAAPEDASVEMIVIVAMSARIKVSLFFGGAL
jgi:hypothetical protein